MRRYASDGAGRIKRANQPLLSGSPSYALVPGAWVPFVSDDIALGQILSFPIFMDTQDVVSNGSCFWLQVCLFGPRWAFFIQSVPSISLRCCTGSSIMLHANGKAPGFAPFNFGSNLSLSFATAADDTTPAGGIYSVTIVNDGPSQPLSFTKSGKDIVIHLATDGAGSSITTTHAVVLGWPYSSEVTISEGSNHTSFISAKPLEYLVGDFNEDVPITLAAADWTVIHNNIYATPGTTLVTWPTTDTLTFSAATGFFRIKFNLAATPSQPLSFARTGDTITVTLATDAMGSPASTTSDVEAAWPYGTDVTVSLPTGTNFLSALSQQSVSCGQGQAWMLRIFEAPPGSAYAIVGDGYDPLYNVADDTFFNGAGAITYAQTIWRSVSDWFNSTTAVNVVVEDSSSFPADIQAGVPFDCTISMKDPRDGSIPTGDSITNVNPWPANGFNINSITYLGGDSWTVNLTVNDTGGMWLVVQTQYQRGRFLFFGPFKVKPGPAASLIDRPPALPVNPAQFNPSPCTGARITSLGGPQVPITALRRDGNFDTWVGTSAAFCVFIVDARGNVVTDSTAPVTIDIDETGTPWKPLHLSGTLTVNAVKGVAIFNNVSVSGLSLTANLRFSSPGLGSFESPLVPIVFNTVVAPETAKAHVTATFTVKVTDAQGVPLFGGDYDPITVADGPLAGGFVADVNPVTPVAGIATFTGKFPSAGIWNLRFTGSGLRYPDNGVLSPHVLVTT